MQLSHVQKQNNKVTIYKLHWQIIWWWQCMAFYGISQSITSLLEMHIDWFPVDCTWFGTCWLGLFQEPPSLTTRVKNVLPTHIFTYSVKHYPSKRMTQCMINQWRVRSSPVLRPSFRYTDWDATSLFYWMPTYAVALNKNMSFSAC